MFLPERQPYSFQDQRQKRIHRRLMLIGEGPAAFFTDACKLIDSPYEYLTTSHLFGHAMREVEGAVLNVLAPPIEDGNDGHRRKIRGTLQILEIPDDGPVTKLWLSLTGDKSLHSLAHRNSQLAPRPVDDKILELWDALQAILDHVLERFEHSYLHYHTVIDELIKLEHPFRADARRLKVNAPNNLVSYGYFFDNITSTEWLAPLSAEGLFGQPVRLEQQGDGISFIQWPQSRFLARVASEAPEAVADIILEIPNTDNISILMDFADAACAMPPGQAVRLFGQAKVWASGPHAALSLLPERMGRLIVHLAEGGYPTESLGLAKVVLALKTPLQDSGQADTREDH